jgi:hypothetical protein
MPLDKRVDFSELALAALRQLVPDDSSRASAVASIGWFLRRDAELQAIKCPAFDDRDLYTYGFWKFRILFEVTDDAVFIWSIVPSVSG